MGDYDFSGVFLLAIGFFITVPFAVWKWVEIIIWLVNHIHISVG